MCGIIGTYGGDCGFDTNTKREFMKDGLYIDALRGKDSTGVAILYKDRTKVPGLFKRALAGADFIQQRHFDILMSNLSDSYGAIGHNRSATRGSTIDEHSHPFQYNHITLVHNGTVSNAEYLLQNADVLKDGMKVDSAHVAWAFSRKEPDELLPKMTGGFSLVWWDARDQSLHFARNSERPMWWAIAKDKRQLYYSSERSFLYTLTNRIGIQLHEDTFLFTQPGIHYVMKNPNNVKEYETRPFTKQGKKKKHKAAGPTGWEKKEPGLITGPQIPANTSGKTTGQSNVSFTGTQNDQTKEGLQPTDKRHDCQIEEIAFNLVGVLDNSAKDARKLQKTIELCEDMGVPFRRVIVCTPLSWRTYKDEAARGYMVVRHNASRALIQVFNVNQMEWVRLGGLGRVPIQVESHRAQYEANKEPVFIGIIRQDILKNFKPQQIPKQEPPSKEQDLDKLSHEEGLGYKEDFVEVGHNHRKWVSPKVFTDMVDCGCYNCSSGITLEDAPKVFWFGPQEDWPICPKCAENDSVIKEWEKVADDSTNSRSVH